MSRHSSLLTAMVGTAGVAAAPMGASPAVAQTADDPVIAIPFAADSGDKCPMGSTKGALGWHSGLTSPRPIVDVKGTVADRPLLDDTDRTCAEDRRFTSARFTAYSMKGVVVDSEIRRVDNDRLGFSFSLTATTPIDLVIVQVCRHPLFPGIDYCGPAQKYPAPRT